MRPPLSGVGGLIMSGEGWGVEWRHAALAMSTLRSCVGSLAGVRLVTRQADRYRGYLLINIELSIVIVAIATTILR